MQHAFFSLVRSGLWGTPADRQLFRVGLAGRLGNRVPHGKLTSPACTDF